MQNKLHQSKFSLNKIINFHKQTCPTVLTDFLLGCLKIDLLFSNNIKIHSNYQQLIFITVYLASSW